MYTLNLTPEETQTLVDVLECSARELRSEIVHTENHCYKQALKDRKQHILSVLENLKQLPAPVAA